LKGLRRKGSLAHEAGDAGRGKKGRKFFGRAFRPKTVRRTVLKGARGSQLVLANAEQRVG